jgi:hypothetical protein
MSEGFRGSKFSAVDRSTTSWFSESPTNRQLTSLWLREYSSSVTRSRPRDQQLPFPGVFRKPGCALVLCASFVLAAELFQEVTAYAWQQVVAFE